MMHHTTNRTHQSLYMMHHTYILNFSTRVCVESMYLTSYGRVNHPYALTTLTSQEGYDM